MSIIDGIKSEIIEKISAGYKEAVSNGSLPETDENIDISSLAKLEVPKDKFTEILPRNIAMVLAKQLKTAPRKIADAITSNIDKSGDIKDIEVAGAGFINFTLPLTGCTELWNLSKKKAVITERLISAKAKGDGRVCQRKSYRSYAHGATPAAELGDCLASVLEYAGYDVTREFYINDAGNQIEKFGKSLSARYIQQLKRRGCN